MNISRIHFSRPSSRDFDDFMLNHCFALYFMQIIVSLLAITINRIGHDEIALVLLPIYGLPDQENM